MKCTKLINLVAVALLAAGLGTGCKKGVVNPTPLHGYGPGQVGDDRTGLNPGRAIGDDPTVPLSGNLGGLQPAENQPEELRRNTVYFAYDRSDVRQSEFSKLDAIASYAKGGNRPIRVEGHCDDRGTEEYNRALGERRALSVREYLVNRAGVSANQIDTISHGEDRPAVPGQNDAARSKNRRAEFLLLQTPSGVGATGPQ